MKQANAKSLAAKVVIFSVSLLFFVAAFVLFCSFKTCRLADDFLKQIGISKSEADERIKDGLLSGGPNLYGLENAKNIAVGNRKAVVLDLIAYVKKQAASPEFQKQYNELRESNKPTANAVQTPAEMRAADIEAARESLASIQEALKKADPSLKKAFQEGVEAAKLILKQTEDPANPYHANYAKNYQQMLKTFKEENAQQIADWEAQYPTNPMLYIKKRLKEFMDETAGIDYGAELYAKNGKKYFMNRAYESKGMYWKMAFRAGRETVEPAREAVRKWMEEISPQTP